MPVVVARLVGDRPDHQAVSRDALERANANAVPGDLALAARRRREAQFFARASAGFRRLRQAINGFRDVRRAGEQAFDWTQVARRGRARKRAVGLVGVDDTQLAVRDEDAVRTGIGDRLGRVEARRPGRQLQHAERVQEQAEGAADGEDDDHPGHQRHADGARRKPHGEKRASEADEEDRQRDRIDRSLNSIHRRGRRRFHLRIGPPRTLRRHRRARARQVARR